MTKHVAWGRVAAVWAAGTALLAAVVVATEREGRRREAAPAMTRQWTDANRWER